MTIFPGFIILTLAVTVIVLIMYTARLSREIRRLHKEIDRLDGAYEESEIPEDKEGDSFGY